MALQMMYTINQKKLKLNLTDFSLILHLTGVLSAYNFFFLKENIYWVERTRFECVYGNLVGNLLSFNPNTFAGLVGKVRKKTISGRRKEGRVEKKSTHPPGPGLEPGTCRVLGEGPPLHARGAV